MLHRFEFFVLNLPLEEQKRLVKAIDLIFCVTGNRLHFKGEYVRGVS